MGRISKFTNSTLRLYCDHNLGNNMGGKKMKICEQLKRKYREEIGKILQKIEDTKDWKDNDDTFLYRDQMVRDCTCYINSYEQLDRCMSIAIMPQ
jgi:hypothetical protein